MKPVTTDDAWDLSSVRDACGKVAIDCADAAGIVDQARNCFATIAAVLGEGGFSLTDVVRVQYTVTDSALVDELAPVLEAFLGDIRPAATMVIASLIRPEMLVEIEATAFRG